MNVSIRVRLGLLAPLFLLLSWLLTASPAVAQNRFTLRAEPDVIAANGISTTSIFVQMPQGRGAIQASPMVRFATTAGVIESQAQLSGGVARVLLRSSNTPGTAIVTAFIGSSREAITVEFSEENGLARRYLEVAAPYVAYGADSSQISASGKTGLDFGETHIESDVRLDVDLATERIWAQGTKGGVVIRHGRGSKAKELRGDRLFYDLRRNRGVMRRAEGATPGESARQEFVGSNFAPPPDDVTTTDGKTPDGKAPDGKAPDGKPKPEEESPVKPPLAPSPSLDLEGEGNRGSTFVVPLPPPTAAQESKNDASPAVVAPEVVGEAAQAQTTDPAKEPTKGLETKDSSDEATESTTRFGDLAAQLNNSTGPSTVAPGSLADTPKTPGDSESRSTALVAVPPVAGNDDVLKPSNAPAYSSLPDTEGFNPKIVELPPPILNVERGYWVASRRLRVFPRDKVQFERASIYFNGKKAFGLPLYVLPLDGTFNPTTDMLSFNSQGGLALKFPFYYQASKGGTGAVYLKRDQGAGFSTQRSGFSLALDQQYWLSPNSHGKFSVDQLGRGAWNLNYQHEMQLSPSTTGSFYLNMPRHRDMFARASLAKELKSMQIGFEAFYDNPETQEANVRGQFFARSRPKAVGKTGWSYTLGANALAVKRGVLTTETVGGGGGVGLPGQNGGPRTITKARALIGQTLTASLRSPVYSPWRGSSFNVNLLSTGFNYSNGRRGFAPGVNLGFGQQLGRAEMRIDYTYDRSNLGLYGLTTDSFTNYLSGSLSAQLTSKIGISTFLSQSMNDDSMYGSADLNYYFAPKWRTGLFADYSNFAETDSFFNYGFSIGRAVGNREVSVNYDTNRGRIYLELGNSRY
jgi:hypothetical protein